jgi:hypothetical protein
VFIKLNNALLNGTLEGGDDTDHGVKTQKKGAGRQMVEYVTLSERPPGLYNYWSIEAVRPQQKPRESP